MCAFVQAVDASRRAVEVAPDPLHRAAALTYLGAALVEAGRNGEAVGVLHSCMAQLDGFSGLSYLRAWASINLCTALLNAGDVEAARQEALRAIELSGLGRLPVMVGRAQRLVGLTQRAGGEHAQGEARLREAVETLAAIHPEREITLLHLAEALRDRGEDTEAAVHLRDALAGFRSRRLDRLVAQAEALARAWGLATVT